MNGYTPIASSSEYAWGDEKDYDDHFDQADAVEQVCGWRFPLPGWAGEDQMDPCTCDLPKGHAPADHKSGHECEHIRAKRIARGETKGDDRG